MSREFDSNDELVDYLVSHQFIESDRVEKAFRNVDRAKFMPESRIENAYSDRPIKIGKDATISAPHIVAINTELLDIDKSDSVIEIGSGSGYQLAILSELAEEVLGVEILGELVKKSRERLSDRENVKIIHGSGFRDVEDGFEKILYSCSINSFETALKHLNHGGCAVAPIRENGSQILKKYENGEITEHSMVSFVSFKDEEVE